MSRQQLTYVQRKFLKRLWYMAQVLGVVVAIAAGAVTIVSYWRGSGEQKSLLLRVDAAEAYLREDVPDNDEITVIVNGSRLASPARVEGSLANNGRSPIRPEDVVSGVALVFPSAAVAAASVSGSSAAEQSATFMLDGTRTVLQHGLLNPGDTINFRLLVDGDPSGLSASCRIVGVPGEVPIQLPVERAMVLPIFAIDLPRPLEWLFIGIAWLFICSMIGISIAATKPMMSDHREATRVARTLLKEAELLAAAADQIKQPDAKAIASAILDRIDLSTLSDPVLMRAVVEDHLDSNSSPSGTAREAHFVANDIRIGLRSGFAISARSLLLDRWPTDTALAESVGALELNATGMASLEDFLERAVALGAEAVARNEKLPKRASSVAGAISAFLSLMMMMLPVMLLGVRALIALL